jgi:hypothetical protein
MIRSPRFSLTAVLTALAVILTGGLPSAVAHCPPSHHAGSTVACCSAQGEIVLSSCLYAGQCLADDHEAVPPKRKQIPPSQPSETATLSSEDNPAVTVLETLLSLEDSSDPPRGSSVPLHLLYAVFLS